MIVTQTESWQDEQPGRGVVYAGNSGRFIVASAQEGRGNGILYQKSFGRLLAT